MAGVRSWWTGEPDRCGASGPGDDRCLERPLHAGWHKSPMHAWPNERESLEHWAEIGRRLRREPMPWLSLKEMEYAMSALAHQEAGEEPTS